MKITESHDVQTRFSFWMKVNHALRWPSVFTLTHHTVRGWHKQYLGEGWEPVAYDGWKGGQSRMSVAQEAALCGWLEGRFCRLTVEIRAHIAAEFELHYSHSGCVKLLGPQTQGDTACGGCRCAGKLHHIL